MTVEADTGSVAAGRRAGFWIRFAGAFVDGLIVTLVTAILIGLIHETGRVIGAAFGIVYYIGLEGGSRGAGLGKQLVGIRVVDQRTGATIGYPRAALRYLGHIVSFVVFLLGYLWMLWDPERQCWHDKFAGDVVVGAS